MHGGSAAADDLDAIEGRDRHRDVAVVMAALAVVEPDAVDEDEALAEGRTTDGEVGLHATTAARPDVDAGHEAQPVNQRRHAEHVQIAPRQCGDSARDRFVAGRCEGGGDDDGL